MHQWNNKASGFRRHSRGETGVQLQPHHFWNKDNASQASRELRGGDMHALSLVGILSRYRRYRDLRMEIQTSALENIPHSSFLAHAKRAGLPEGNFFFQNDV